MGGLRFAVLGPLEVWAGQHRVRLVGRQQPVVLAALLLNANRVVSVDRLVECLWGVDPPPAGRRLVHGCVAGLRRVLREAGGEQPLLSRAPGYLVEADPATLDLAEFTELAAAGRAAAAGGEPARAAELLAAAGRLWRGPVLDGLVLPEFAGELAGLAEDRLTVLEDRIDADLRLRRPASVVGELQGLVAAHPLRERLWAQLMVALAGADRRADALAAYQRVRTILVDELGIEPGPLLLGVHQAVLAGAEPLAALRVAQPGANQPPDPPGPAAGRPVPAQLPADVAAFSGRTAELAALTGLLTGRPGAAVVISAVSGTAGVGKTALAVHWAHQVADRFPDGQLYVNLRGFDPTGQIAPPGQVVRGFLDALDVPPERIPTDLDAQTALYRSLLADKRVLVVLDNARDADQVRPLLPGAPTALALITSRNQLTPLVAADAAHPLSLDLLTPAEARDLLTNRLGRDRITAEPAAADEIITRCAGLPLALTIVAARAAVQPTFPLATLAAELTTAGLTALTAGSTSTDLRTVFSWSYTALTPAAARLFRLLGLHPGPYTTAPAAASLAALPLTDVGPVLAELVRAGLLSEPAPGRYTFHDLLRAYATDLTLRTDTNDNRQAAVTRLLDYYLHSAHTADRHLNPARDPIPIPLASPAPGASPEQVGDQHTAMAWSAAERPALLAAQRLAATSGRDAHAWQLAWSLDTVLDRRTRWDELAGAWLTALPAAKRLPHPAAAYAHRNLGQAMTNLGDYEQAHAHLGEALRLNIAAADPVSQGYTHIAMSFMWERRGRLDRAFDSDQRALALLQAAGHRRGQANALNNVGWYHALRGDHTHAVSDCQQALRLYEQVGDHRGAAATWDTLGYAHHHLGHHAQAADCYQHAITLFGNLGDRYHEAETLTRLGDTKRTAGRPDGARAAWTTALAILTDLDHPDADAVRAKLHDLDG